MAFTADWFSHNIPDWTKWLAGFQHRSDVRILEIGSFEGRASVWLLDNVLTGPAARLACLDIWSGPTQGVREYRGEDAERRLDENLLPYAGRFDKLKGPSELLLPRLLIDGRTFDGIYVDGDLYGPVVLRDAVLAFQLLRPGGILIFDDYLWRMPIVSVYPGEAIDALLHIFRNELHLIAKGSQVAVGKRPKE